MAADRGLDEWHRWQRYEKWRQAMTTAKEDRASEPIKDCDSCPEMVVVRPARSRWARRKATGMHRKTRSRSTP